VINPASFYYAATRLLPIPVHPVKSLKGKSKIYFTGQAGQVNLDTPWQACDKIILFGVNSPAGGCEGIPNLSRRSRLLQTKKIVIPEKLVLAKVGNRESSFY